MAGEHKLPGLGLMAYWTLGSNGYKDQMDENFLLLSSLAQPVIKSQEATEPGTPTDGDVHIATAAWGAVAAANDIVIRDNGAWTAVTPNEGWSVYDAALDNLYRFDGASWVLDSGGGSSMVQTEITVDGNLTNDHLRGGNVVRFNSASPIVLTIPTGLTEAEPAEFIRVGSGDAGFKADVGVTIHAAEDKKGLRLQYSHATLIPDVDTADTYYLVGDLGPFNSGLQTFQLPLGVPDPIVWFNPVYVEVDGSSNITKILNLGTGGSAYDATADTANLANVTQPAGWGGRDVFNIPNTGSGGYDFGEVDPARTAIAITTYNAGAATFSGYDGLVSGSAAAVGDELQIGGQQSTDHFATTSNITFFKEGAPLASNGDTVLPISKQTVAVTCTKTTSKAGKLWRDNYDSSRNWKGLMGDLLIFDSVLTNQQISDLHDAMTAYYA